MAAERTPAGTEFFSAHIERLREAMATLDVNDEPAKVEAEIEASKVHWSELSNAYFSAVEGPATESSSSSQSEWASEVEGTPEWSLKVAGDNVELFRSLQKQYPGGFFLDEDDVGSDRVHKLPLYTNGRDGHPLFVKVELSSEKPFAEGAQAELFHAHFIREADGSKALEIGVMKVFKEGTSLKDLLRLLAPAMLKVDSIGTCGIFGYDINCNPILGARLLKSSGRFAFLTPRAWGDLQKLIDVRMVHFNNKGLPFQNNVTIYIMHRIALGMQGLHRRDIIHRDLKVANVLIWARKESTPYKPDPISLEPYVFWCSVADYECSVGVIGTRFWRAPGILLGLKNQNIHQNLEVFTKQSDVYSFGMTCYEILTGGIPFKDLRTNDYDGVIGGNRPTLPNQTTPWMMDLGNRCWHKDLLMRPSFEEIVKIALLSFMYFWVLSQTKFEELYLMYFCFLSSREIPKKN